MIIVRQWGGLGNQMFIDAFVEALHQEGKNVLIDTSYYDYFSGEYQINNIFGIKREIATREQCHKYAIYELDRIHRLIRKCLPNILYPKTQIRIIGTENQIYHPELFDISEGYIEGYFQTEKYFSKIEQIIKDNYKFKNIDNTNAIHLKEVENSESISLHIRRGDYLKQDNSFHVCSKEYYRRAIAHMENMIPKCKFIVFSNDLEWCKNEFGISDRFYYVDGNSGINSYRDLQLMSKCKHNIIANSTFSWWGAWLNENPHKIVCCPRIWFAPNFAGDIIPESWTKVDI